MLQECGTRDEGRGDDVHKARLCFLCSTKMMNILLPLVVSCESTAKIECRMEIA